MMPQHFEIPSLREPFLPHEMTKPKSITMSIKMYKSNKENFISEFRKRESTNKHLYHSTSGDYDVRWLTPKEASSFNGDLFEKISIHKILCLTDCYLGDVSFTNDVKSARDILKGLKFLSGRMAGRACLLGKLIQGIANWLWGRGFLSNREAVFDKIYQIQDYLESLDN